MKIIHDARRVPRENTLLKARITHSGGFTSIPCLVRNFSKAGANLVLPDNTPLPPEFELHIPTRQSHFRVALVWRNEEICGVEFLRSIQSKEAQSPFSDSKPL
jgi:hypothetical protein